MHILCQKTQVFGPKIICGRYTHKGEYAIVAQIRHQFYLSFQQTQVIVAVEAFDGNISTTIGCTIHS